MRAACNPSAAFGYCQTVGVNCKREKKSSFNIKVFGEEGVHVLNPNVLWMKEVLHMSSAERPCIHTIDRKWELDWVTPPPACPKQEVPTSSKRSRNKQLLLTLFIRITVLALDTFFFFFFNMFFIILLLFHIISLLQVILNWPIKGLNKSRWGLR